MLPKSLSVKVPLLCSRKDFAWKFSIAVHRAAGDFRILFFHQLSCFGVKPPTLYTFTFLSHIKKLSVKFLFKTGNFAFPYLCVFFARFKELTFFLSFSQPISHLFPTKPEDIGSLAVFPVFKILIGNLQLKFFTEWSSLNNKHSNFNKKLSNGSLEQSKGSDEQAIKWHHVHNYTYTIGEELEYKLEA